VRRKIEGLRENLEEFVEQTDYSLLIVSCTPEEGMYASQLLTSLDETRPDSLFWVFVDPFEAASEYVGALLESLERQLAAGSAVRVERGEPPFEPIPAALKDPRLEPAQRFEGLVRFLPRLVDPRSGETVVVGLLPTACRDEAAFARLLARVLPHPRRPEWMVPLRIVTLDPRERPQLPPLLERQNIQTVLTFQLDFSTPALTAALSADAADPSVPLPERMANLLQLAALDFSYQRHADAQEKYAVLHAYYAEPHQPGMQALCLLGAGDSLEATGEPGKAKLLLERGIDLCLKHDEKVPLLQLLVAMIRVCTTLGLHGQAESYANSGLTIALALVNGPVYTFLVEKKGDAQMAQLKHEQALTTYEYARKLAETYSVYPIWKSVLEKLEAEHAGAGRRDRASDMRREWQRVDALERKGVVESSPRPHAPPAQMHA
jgi:tetratricopeptide (TPR) repeat protein